jgi:hypothetical protein
MQLSSSFPPFPQVLTRTMHECDCGAYLDVSVCTDYAGFRHILVLTEAGWSEAYDESMFDCVECVEV